MEAPRNIVLLGASYSTKNLGVSALASGVVASALHGRPDAKVVLLEYDRDPSTHPVRHADGVADVEQVNLRFTWRFWLRNNIALLILLALMFRLVPGKERRNRWMASYPYLKDLAEADLIAAIAGGDSFSDIYGMRRFYYVCLPQILVIAAGKPLVLLPQTLGPFERPIAKRIAGWIMRRAKVVYARDQESLEKIRPLTKGADPDHFRFAYDMGFALEPYPPEEDRLAPLKERDMSRPLVGLNISGLLYMGGYSQDNMFGLKADYAEMVRSLVRGLAEAGATVMLVPHVFSSGPENDSEASRVLYDELKEALDDRLLLLEGGFDQHQIKYCIGQCDFFLGSRMHACIAALSQCIPAVGLAYSRKFRGVYRSISQEDLVADLRTLDHDAICDKAMTAYAERDAHREKLEATIPKVRKSVLNLLANSV